MAHYYNEMDLRNLFQSTFKKDKWQSLLMDIFGANEIRATPELLETSSDNELGYYLGRRIASDMQEIGFFYYKVNKGNITKKRVGLRNLVRPYLKWNFDAALAVFDDGKNWRVSFISDIRNDATNPKRYTYVFGDNTQYYHTAISRFMKLQSDGISFTTLKDAFSVEALSKDFYNKLYQWYQWALSDEMGITFPDNPNTVKDDRDNINVKVIRLITRILFVWFIKQKKIVPNEIFDKQILKKILRDFDPLSIDDGKYYNAILQNLFFATLNCAVIDEEGNPRQFSNLENENDSRNFYHYAEMFSISKSEVIKLFTKIPFLNGGLFECLDKLKSTDIGCDINVFFDGFCGNETQKDKYCAHVPNKLFFNDDEKQPGLITLLNQYNFTIEENSPNDAQISLDPELLGRAFENLLAAYNPETKESARKSTGSFYTPREIVDYMVNEALIAHIKEQCTNLNKKDVRSLFTIHEKPKDWTSVECCIVIESLKSMKILDPACGSGAFPMGCLLKMVEIIELLQDNSVNRYQLKLDIIENCIYGIDIQPIAMLISKLRFFISLICEQNEINLNDPEHNYGINILPNLETKFIAANTLISANIRGFESDWTRDEHLELLKNELLQIRHNHFYARSQHKKKKIRKDDDVKREEILSYITKYALQPNYSLIKEKLEEIDKLKSELILYKDEYWVDEWFTPTPNLFEEVKPTLFRHDVNKNKRDNIHKKIRTCQEIIKKEESKEILQGFEAAVEQLTKWNPYDQNATSPFFDPEWMFGLTNKFDIVIGNPPYISTKGVSNIDKKLYDKEYNFADDTYNHFFFKGSKLLKKNGVLTYIIPKTFWTTQTKRNLRDLLLSQKINYIFDTANPFEAAMVDTCIISFCFCENNRVDANHIINFFDGTESLSNPKQYTIEQNIYLNTQNSVIFKPTEENLKIYKLYGQKVKDLYNKWWDKISTSKNITKHKKELEEYRKSLKPGNLTLLGTLTEGGVGLQTGNNGKYIAVRKSTKWAKNIIESRPKKLVEAIRKYKISIDIIAELSNVSNFLDSLNEKQIAILFDNLKEEYGRDIFGQGYLYKLVDDNEIADVNTLTNDEKENGIEIYKNYYVPYDKGDKDGNRWYLETPFAIAWSRENVQFLKTNSGKKGAGMPVVRNPQFNFKEGFCWTDINSTFLKARLKRNGVFDVVTMSLFTQVSIPDWYFVCLINTRFISFYVDNFINNTSHFQINDARQLPILIPTDEQLAEFKTIFKKAYSIKQSQIEKTIMDDDVTNQLSEVQYILDIKINELYGI